MDIVREKIMIALFALSFLISLGLYQFTLLADFLMRLNRLRYSIGNLSFSATSTLRCWPCDFQIHLFYFNN